MKICSLASGSKGNCLYLETGDTRVMIDVGMSLRETLLRMGSRRRIGIVEGDIETSLDADRLEGLGLIASHPAAHRSTSASARIWSPTAKRWAVACRSASSAAART